MKTQAELLNLIEEVGRTAFTGSRGQGFLGDLPLDSTGTNEAGKRIRNHYEALFKQGAYKDYQPPKTYCCVVECRNSAYEQSLIVNANSEEDAKKQISDYQKFDTVFVKALTELKFLETGHPGVYPLHTHARNNSDSLDD